MFRTASFRLATLYVVVFAVSAMVLGGAVFLAARSVLRQQMAAHIEVEAAFLRDEFHAGGLDRLLSVVRTRGRDASALDYLVQDGRGLRLAGEMPAVGAAPRPGWLIVEVPDAVEDGGREERVRALVTSLDQGIVLTVGDDLGRITEVETSIATAFVWTVGLVALLGIGGGILLSRGFLARVDAITRTAEAIIGGDLARRVPFAGTGDDLDRLAGALNQMLDRIGALMDSLRQVSGDVAHDLRTPLTRLYQRLKSARTHAGSIGDYEAAVDGAVREAEGLLDTFSALLRIAQVEGASPRAGFGTVDLSGVVDSVADAYRPDAEEAGHRLVADVSPGIFVHGDQELLTQASANLVENALRHTPAGTRIGVSLSREPGAGARLVVEDDGPGVDEAELPRLTHRFYRSEGSRTTPGNGLGLSLVAAVAELHGTELLLERGTPGLRATLRLLSGRTCHRQQRPACRPAGASPRGRSTKAAKCEPIQPRVCCGSGGHRVPVRAHGVSVQAAPMGNPRIRLAYHGACMISYAQSILLGLLQGVSELFSISSLGHSVIIPRLLGWQLDQASDSFVSFIVLTHMATAVVLLVFFWRDWLKIVAGILRSLRQREIRLDDTYARLGWLLVVSTVPAGLLGILFEQRLKTLFAAAEVAAVLVLNGAVLYLVELVRRRHLEEGPYDDRRVAALSWRQSVLIGCYQCLALVPGFSRTGLTMAGGMIAGDLSHENSVRYSFLLATPIIFAAALLKVPEIFAHGGTGVGPGRPAPRSRARGSSGPGARATARPTPHRRPPAGRAHLGVKVARLLGVETVRLDTARGDQPMRVPVGPLALRLRPVRPVHVELHRQALGDEMLGGETPSQRDPVLGGDLAVGRQRQHDLARHLGVFPALGPLGCIPQHARLGEPRRRALGQQQGVVGRRVAVAEVEHLADALGRDRVAPVVGRRAHRAAAGAARDVAGAGELDGHGGSLLGPLPPCKPRRSCDAYWACTPPLA